MAEYLFVADRVPPVASDESAAAVAGLARALSGAKHRVTIISVGELDEVSRLPGMARRLRTVTASAAGETMELPLFEGRSAHGQSPLYVLAAPPADRARTAALLGSGAATLVRDGLVKPDAVIGWGDTAAAAVAAVPAALRVFVCPTGTTGSDFSAAERAVLEQDQAVDSLSASSFLALAATEAHALVVPSPSAVRALEQHPGLAARASDQPVVAIRFGADEPPYDPAGDSALPATYSSEAPGGKAECRKALAKKAGLSVGPRTLLICAPALAGETGKAVLDALARVVRHDVAIALSASGERALLDQANVISIENPGKIAILAEAGPTSERQLLAGADAVLFPAPDATGRTAGMAQRYGTLPIAVENGAHGDYLVDYDVSSATGSALLFASLEAHEIETALRRAISMRANADLWQPLVKSLLLSAPRWSGTAAQIEALGAAAEPRPELAVSAAG